MTLDTELFNLERGKFYEKLNLDEDQIKRFNEYSIEELTARAYLENKIKTPDEVKKYERLLGIEGPFVMEERWPIVKEKLKEFFKNKFSSRNNLMQNIRNFIIICSVSSIANYFLANMNVPEEKKIEAMYQMMAFTPLISSFVYKRKNKNSFFDELVSSSYGSILGVYAGYIVGTTIGKLN